MNPDTHECAMCGNSYSARRKNEATFLCSICSTPQLLREAVAVRNSNYRAKKQDLPATLTLKQWVSTLNHFQWRCAYCGDTYQALDHFIPLTRGGGTTANNCVPSCIDCNKSKFNTSPDIILKSTPTFLCSALVRFKPSIRRIRIYLRSLN